MRKPGRRHARSRQRWKAVSCALRWRDTVCKLASTPPVFGGSEHDASSRMEGAAAQRWPYVPHDRPRIACTGRVGPGRLAALERASETAETADADDAARLPWRARRKAVFAPYRCSSLPRRNDIAGEAKAHPGEVTESALLADIPLPPSRYPASAFTQQVKDGQLCSSRAC